MHAARSVANKEMDKQSTRDLVLSLSRRYGHALLIVYLCYNVGFTVLVCFTRL